MDNATEFTEQIDDDALEQQEHIALETDKSVVNVINDEEDEILSKDQAGVTDSAAVQK